MTCHYLGKVVDRVRGTSEYELPYLASVGDGSGFVRFRSGELCLLVHWTRQAYMDTMCRTSLLGFPIRRSCR